MFHRWGQGQFVNEPLGKLQSETCQNCSNHSYICINLCLVSFESSLACHNIIYLYIYVCFCVFLNHLIIQCCMMQCHIQGLVTVMTPYWALDKVSTVLSGEQIVWIYASDRYSYSSCRSKPYYFLFLHLNTKEVPFSIQWKHAMSHNMRMSKCDIHYHPNFGVERFLFFYFNVNQYV